jgi:hypothetical protein
LFLYFWVNEDISSTQAIWLFQGKEHLTGCNGQLIRDSRLLLYGYLGTQIAVLNQLHWCIGHYAHIFDSQCKGPVSGEQEWRGHSL